ncbi:MAG TPA: hypothetical protein VFA66_16205 [Gaiellaceae bacterium]|nr:hypothetical protein [Gaiellaceae bacterium]
MTAIALILVGAIVVALALAGGGPARAKRAAPFHSCSPLNSPGLPLELNAAATGVLVKTVAMQEELFACQDSPSSPTAIRDLETFVELVGREAGGNVDLVSTKVMAVTCDQRVTATGAITCGKSAINAPSAPGPNATQCNPRAENLVMNTVATDDSLFVTTTELDAEKFTCNANTRNDDLYLFTQLLEPVHANLQDIDDPVFSWLGVFCNQNRDQGKLKGCVRFTPSAAINPPGSFTCFDTGGPAFPKLDGNSVAAALLVKTVAMQKHILSCNTGSGTAFTRDQQLFVDVIDRQSGNSLAFLAAKVFVSTCDKASTSQATTLACAASTVPLSAGPAPNLGACQEQGAGLDPVVMNTVRTKDGKVVKTIKLHQENYRCTSTIWRDVYVFSQLIEPVNGAGDNFASPTVRLLGVSCDRDAAGGVVTGCVRFTPGPLQ